MAKKSTALKAVEGPAIDRELLASIASGGVTQVTRDQAFAAGLQMQPPLIDVGQVDMATGTAPVRINENGAAYLTQGASPLAEVKPVEASKFEVISGAVLPPSKRGAGLHGGAPVKYPFDVLEVGASFFVPVSAKQPDPVKSLGSTISSANLRYAKQIGEKTVTRAKRGKGNKLELVNGEKVMETKTVPVWELTRKFEIRGVEKDQMYGTWKAPDDGALIARVK